MTYQLYRKGKDQVCGNQDGSQIFRCRHCYRKHWCVGYVKMLLKILDDGSKPALAGLD